MEKNMMSLMLLLIISVAAFNIVSALVMVVAQKQGDIAILRTQGMQSAAILGIFVMNGLYNGIKGTVFGVVGGLLLVYQINPILHLVNAPIMLAGDGHGVPVDVQWSQIAFLVVLSVGLCLLATLYPAYRALSVQPASALKYE
jgi:lipoprotein-releasing system permease protein